MCGRGKVAGCTHQVGRRGAGGTHQWRSVAAPADLQHPWRLMNAMVCGLHLEPHDSDFTSHMRHFNTFDTDLTVNMAMGTGHPPPSPPAGHVSNLHGHKHAFQPARKHSDFYFALHMMSASLPQGNAHTQMAGRVSMVWGSHLSSD